LQRLGLVLHITPSRNIITKVENVPRIGEVVVDENLKPVGKIFDVFGPVSSPYASIKSSIQKPDNLVSKTVYVIPSKRRKERKNYGRR
jgi:RNA-binding protein